jgi:hypothetical protein
MKVILTKARKTDLGLRRRLAAMCDLSTITFFRTGALLRRSNLYQAFSQPTGPGRLWISLDALLLQYQIDPLINQTNPTQSRSKQPKTVT